MKKTLFLIIGLLVLCFLLLLIAFLALNRKSSPLTPSSPIPTPITGSTQNHNSSLPLSIVSTSPTDQSTNIPINTSIKIVFSRPITSKEIAVGISPNINFTTSISQKTLTIIPTSPLASGTPYAVFLGTQNGLPLNQFAFTTEGTGPINNPQYDPINDLNNTWLKQYEPDGFLYNQTPYQTSSFSISSSFVSTPTEHFMFLVKLSNSAQGKNDFISWLKGLGLTQQQISSLDIQYQ